MHVQSCCFVYLNLSLFCRSRCRRRRPCLSSLISLFWNFRGLNELPEMRFEFPLNFIRKLIIKARTQILVHGGRGGRGAGQGFRCCFADGLNQSLQHKRQQSRKLLWFPTNLAHALLWFCWMYYNDWRFSYKPRLTVFVVTRYFTDSKISNYRL